MVCNCSIIKLRYCFIGLFWIIADPLITYWDSTTYFTIVGLVLFHTRHFWLNGISSSNNEYGIEELSPGSDVSFYHYQIEDDGYRHVISPDGTLRQAAAVWRGKRPSHILKGEKS